MRKAAARLNVSPSSLNRQILALEDELGSPLFERLPRNLRLTASGELIVAHVRRTMREIERLDAQLEDLKGLRRGEVSIAAMAGLASNFLTGVTVDFQVHHPRVKVIFKRGTLQEIMAAVLAGEVDLGLAFGARRDAAIRVLAEIECRLGVVVAPQHPLAGKPHVKLAECVGYPIILPGPSMVFRGILDDAFAKASLTVDGVIETTEFEMMKRFAALNRGIVFLNQINIDVERRRGELVFVPIRDPNLAGQTLCLFHGVRSGLSVRASQYAEALRTALEDIGPANI
jgi:DNA-binding transcriptional LysR family regulator